MQQQEKDDYNIHTHEITPIYEMYNEKHIKQTVLQMWENKND
jgi:hypothetical protein